MVFFNLNILVYIQKHEKQYYINNIMRVLSNILLIISTNNKVVSVTAQSHISNKVTKKVMVVKNKKNTKSLLLKFSYFYLLVN